MKVIDQVALKKYIHYNPSTGVFTRIKSDSNAHKAGAILSPNTPRGYIEVSVMGFRQFAHRLAFIYMTGHPPKHGVDHINGDTTDNRWCNLRDVPQQVNMKNRSISRNNTSGCVGVTRRAGTERWRSYITIDDRQVHLGWYGDFFEAVCARKSAENKHGFSERHGCSTRS